MDELLDRRTRLWAILAITIGAVTSLGLEFLEEPEMSPGTMLLEFVNILPVVAMAVGVVLLFRIASRQREEQMTLLRDLEVARLEGQRWRSESRTLISGLGEAIDGQFTRWNLTDAEREVALLLLKGLAIKEIAALRATGERTIRAQAAALYSKAGVTGRAALSAFFLEDLLAPIEQPH